MIGMTILTGAASTWLAGVFRRVVARIFHAIGREVAPRPAPPPSPWLAGSTHRWHTNPIFAATRDRVDAHSARVGILILQFMPDAPVELLRRAIVYDLGENAVGDMASPIKRNNPDLYTALEGLEADALAAMEFGFPNLAPDLAALLHLCDGLDAYLWAAVHRPDYVRGKAAWCAMFARLRARALDLGLLEKFDEIVAGVTDGKF